LKGKRDTRKSDALFARALELIPAASIPRACVRLRRVLPPVHCACGRSAYP